MKSYQRSLLILGITCLTFLMLFISFGEAQNGRSSASRNWSARRKETVVSPSRKPAANAGELLKQGKKGNSIANAFAKPRPSNEDLVPYSSAAVAFIETPAVRDLKAVQLSPEEMDRLNQAREEREKNESNTRRVKPEADPSMTAPFTDPTLKTSDSSKSGKLFSGLATTPLAVTNPLQNFDGPDMDQGAILFGGRFAPPDTNGAVGPNHFVITTNAGFQVFSKAGVALTPLTKISSLLAGIPNAADDDGDPIVLYDGLADRWLISQFNLRVTNNSTHEHIAISKTGDPTGAYYAYDFLLTPNRPGDYPHLGVWPNGYYMSTNDLTLPAFSSPFQGAGLYAFERNKMLAGDPTAKIIGFNTNNQHSGMLPTNLQGFSTPPAGTPNLFIEFDADEFGAPFDLIRAFVFHADFAVPANSTLIQGPDIPVAPFDARSPVSRAVIDQPAPGEGLDAIADRLMHAMNFRVLPGGAQSYVLNWTVNVSGVNPTTAALYQGGVRWMELRRDAGSGTLTVNQQATYAPGSGSGLGRNLWMASVGQDGEGNIGLAASATGPGPVPAAQNPTAIYTGRLAGDPANTLPQGEIDALSAVTKGVQTATFNRWGDYSSLFVDPADDCTYWGAFEYVDSPTATFDWNTRIFSFRVNPTCVTPARGSFSGVITDCETGLPIQGATVQTVDGFLRTTDAAGAYSVTNMAPGTYSVTVSKPGFGFNTVTGSVTVTDGGNAIFNACLQGVPIIAAAGSTLVAESCPPTNGAIDPDERVSVNLRLTNTGGGSTTNLVATLQSNAGVIAPSGPQSYGVIAPAGTAGRDFSFTANGTCGSTITATLQLQDGANNLGTVSYTFLLGVTGAPATRSFTFSPGVAIPDNAPTGVNIPFVVSGIGPIGDLNFRIDGGSCNTTNPSLTVGVDHSWVGDLVFKLTSPGGTTVTIIDRPGSGTFGSSGNNFCQTLLDDDGSFPPIDSIASTGAPPLGPPYTGTFLPQNALSAFDGQNANGTWTLNVSDNAGGDTGFVRAFSLIITPVVCTTPCGGVRLVVTSTLTRPTAGTVQASYSVQNIGSTTANNVMLTTAKLGSTNGTPLSQSLGNIAPGGSASSTVFFATSSTGASTLTLGGTYTGGTFSSTKRVTIP